MTKEFFMAKACARIRRLVDAVPVTAGLSLNAMRLWNKSQILNHPHVQLDRGFVFIHVPKTAGTSLRKALGITASLSTSRHDSAREIMPFIKRIAPKTISIAFVRNPYDRFVSLYSYARMDESLYHSAKNPKQAPFGKHHDYDILSDKSLEQCAELLVQGKLGDPEQTLTIWHPQVEWLTDRQRKLMVDYIGRVESLDADLQNLHKLHGIVIEPIPWLNKSSDHEKNVPFTKRTRDLIRLYYKRDFEMLGYNETPESNREMELR
jgi:hypothetical protein